jgi:hypothetical protein
MNARRIALFTAAACFSAQSPPAPAQVPLGTGFTYQGKLNVSGSPGNGSVDFQFRLYNALSGGALLAAQAASNVSLDDGLFTVTLDFGAAAFNGDARWLEIDVRSPAGGGAFTTLSPRQSITAAPYALKVPGLDGHSLNASDGSPVDALFINASGLVGIGTTSPVTKLYIDEPSNVAAVLTIDSGATSIVQSAIDFRDRGVLKWGMGKGFSNEFYLDDTAGGGRRLTIPSGTGTLGIGTTAPLAGLHVRKEAIPPGGTLALEGDTHTYMTFFPDGAAAGRKAFFGFPSAGSNSISLFNEIPGGNIVLTPGAGGVVSVPVLEITGADLAEKFPTTETVDPGMVVAIDPQNAGKLCLARGSYNRCVAGVVSGANHFAVGAVLGNLPGYEDAPPIALSGRVYVWCDAAGAAIQPGDLLTTSDTPGHAMKATNRERSHGAVIGKAMTALARGEKDLVLVLVNLQ